MIVVTGATGNVGRPLIEALAEAGEQVVAVSRRPLPSRQDGVPSRPGRPRQRRAAAGPRGADAFFILLAGELLGYGEAATDLLAAARDAGVKRVVLLSSQINATRPDSASHGRLREFEEAVRG